MTSPADPGPLVERLRAAGCVYAEDEARLLLDQPWSTGERQRRVERRCAGEPLEQVLGWVQFAGLRLALAAGVFVPRRRTELLARQASARVASGSVVVDLCCGCGAVGAAVARREPDVELHAVDVDPAALVVARRNLAGARAATTHLGDLYAALPERVRGRVDVVVANAPYVPSTEIELMPREAREHEPRTALDGGRDGAEIQRRVLAGAPDWLARGGWVLVETSEALSPLTLAAARAAGLSARLVRDDALDAVVLVAARRGSRAPEGRDRSAVPNSTPPGSRHLT